MWLLESGAYDYYWDSVEPPAYMHEKIVKIRKGIKGSGGKPMTQRNFAKFLAIQSISMTRRRRLRARGSGAEGHESEVRGAIEEKLEDDLTVGLQV